MTVVIDEDVCGVSNSCPIGGPAASGGNNPVTPVAITSSVIPTAVEGTAVSFTPTATGSPPPAWTASNDEGLIGLSVDINTGLTTFIAPVAGTYHITYVAFNGTGDSVTHTFTSIAAAVDATISSTTLADTYVGQVPVSGYFIPVTVAGTGPFTFSLTAGTLPSGITLVTDPIADPTQGIFFGTPDTPGAGTSITLKVTGASGVLSAGKTFADGIAVYQFPDISTTTFPDLASNTAVGSGHNVTMTGYPAPTNLSITSGGPTGFALSGTGTASGSVGYADANTYTVNLSCSTTCGSFGVQTATRSISLLVYVGNPTGLTLGWDAQYGKTFDANGKCDSWASFVGSVTLTPAGWNSAFGTTGKALEYDSTNIRLGNTGSSERIGAVPGAVAVPHHVGFYFYHPANETSGSARMLFADSGFSPSIGVIDNGSSTRQGRYANGGIAITSTNTLTRGGYNTLQGWTESATNIGLKLNADTDVTSTGATAAGSIANLGLFPNTPLANAYIRRWGYGTAVMDRSHFRAWLLSSYIPGTPPPNPGTQTASITYPTASSTIQPGGHYIVVDRGTVPQAGTTGVDIYENGGTTPVYSYPGDGGASGIWDTYIHHCPPGTKSYQAIVRNSITGDVTTASVGSITVPAQVNGTFRGSIFMHHLHQSGGVTGRLRIALPDNPYDAVLTNSKIAGVFMNVEWPDYETSLNSYTTRNLLTNCDYCWARGKYLFVNLPIVSYWGGTGDTSSVPAYIRDGSTATYGTGYTGAGNITNGKAGVSGRASGGSTPHFWNTNVMNRWKAFIDYLATQLMPNGVRYPGFWGINMNESTWAVQSNNNANSALINAYGGNQGYGYGNQLIYWDQVQYVASKFPGVPVYASYNGPDGGGGNSTTLMRQAMDRSRAAGHWATGMHDLMMPKTAPFSNYSQAIQNPAQLYTAYWPVTERTAITMCEDPKLINNTTGDRTTAYWQEFVDNGIELYGCDTFCYGLTGGMASPGVPNYPSTNWTTNASWTTYFSILRNATTVADYLTNQYS